MNLIIGAPWWLIVLLGIALMAAAVEDALRLKISNLTCAAVFGAALVAAGMHGLSTSLWQNAVVCIAILAIGTPAFAAGWLGGGDVKLLAAIGLWLDLQAAAGLVVAVSVVGGLVALIYIVARRMLFAGQPGRKRYGKIPYGLAIVAGTLFVFGTQLSHRPSNPYIDRLRAAEATRG